MSTSTTQRRFYLFSHPRTTSNLFMRLLESHPQLEQRRYFSFGAYFIGPERQALSPIEVYQYMPGFDAREQKTYQKGFDELVEWVGSVEGRGKIPLIMDHCHHLSTPSVPHDPLPRPSVSFSSSSEYTNAIQSTLSDHLSTPNPTFFPTPHLLTYTPIFLTRHPALVGPSFLRAIQTSAPEGTPSIHLVSGGEYPTCLSYKNTVDLFNWYKKVAESVGEEQERERLMPIIVDGERLVNHTKEVMEKLCSRLGVDPEGVKYEWKPKDAAPPALTSSLDSEKQEEKKVGPPGSNTMNAFIGKVMSSTGVIQHEEKEISIDEEEKKWAEEWDVETARKMAELARGCMGDYEYLRGFSL